MCPLSRGSSLECAWCVLMTSCTLGPAVSEVLVGREVGGMARLQEVRVQVLKAQPPEVLAPLRPVALRPGSGSCQIPEAGWALRGACLQGGSRRAQEWIIAGGEQVEMSLPS